MSYPINSAIPIMLGNKRSSQSMPAANPDVLEILLQLDALFSKKIFPLKKKQEAPVKKTAYVNHFGIHKELNPVKYSDNIKPLYDLLNHKLSPRKVEPEKWDNGSILDIISHEHDTGESIIEKLLQDTEGSQLYFNYLQKVKQYWFNLPYNQKLVFRADNSKFIYPGIVAYLVSYAYFLKGIEDLNALSNFISEHDHGFKAINQYVLISATRKMVDTGNIDFTGINDDKHRFFSLLSKNDLSFQSTGFKYQVLGMVNNYLSNGQYDLLIDKWNDNNSHTVIDEKQNPVLYNKIISLLKSYNSNNLFIVDDDSILTLMPSLIMQAMGQMHSNGIDVPSYSNFISTGDDFNVEFVEDDQSVTEINILNVKCASQLYYAMIIGDELEVFNAVNYLTNNYLVRGGMEIKDRKLRENLQMYVFSNKFRDSSGREMDKTRPAERQMFYRQVFNFGTAPVTDSLIINSEFTRLWKVLILEVAKYLERVQDSPNPLNFVSKQNVMQTVEDLQYNLSTHCTGMVNVITPIIYQELNFVIREILNHEEIRKQVVPAGGSWWRVVESLYASMRSRRTKTTAINNKAKTGYEILKKIAEFTPSTFEDDDVFFEFISSVDNFITTQSILQESMVDQIKQSDRTLPAPDDEFEPAPQSGKVAPVAAGADEWDF